MTKRVRADGVPTMFELAREIADLDTDFLKEYLRAASIFSASDLVFERFAQLGADYSKRVKGPASDFEWINNVTNEQQCEMETRIVSIRERLANLSVIVTDRSKAWEQVIAAANLDSK